MAKQTSIGQHNQQLGSWGEQRAGEFLQDKGYTILGRNIRTPYGEIDLLAEKDGQLVFVEVKTRSNAAFGAPEESITPLKREHLVACAESYLQSLDCQPQTWRIDVIAILGKPGRKPFEITWFENALV